MITTDIGNNWLVIVFECPIISIDKILIDIWDDLSSKKDVTLIPHYTIRASNHQNNTAIISLRILTKVKNSNEFGSIDVKIKNNGGIILGGEKYQEYHKWIPPDETDAKWTNARCEILSELSLLAISLMKKGEWHSNNVCSRPHTIHLLSNMLGFTDNVITDFLLKKQYSR